MAQGYARDFPEVPDRPSPVTLYPWLLVAAGAARDAVDGKFHPAWLAGCGLLAFAGLYMAATWVMPFRGGHGPPLTLLVVFVVAAVSMLTAIGQGASAGDIWSAWYGPALAGVIVAIIYRFIQAVAELRSTREELARAAVDAERLRFARDLHDLLGHTLSVMVVKAQVTRKLAARDPELAAQQALDIEEIGREALTEVRQTVAGYQGRGLARELEAARTALAGAGLTVAVRQDGPPVPAGADALLGWVVREGVTNVIRHSGGHECQVEVRNDGGCATVTIRDDGTGEPAAGALPSGGHGLDGLRERLAADGGTLIAGPGTGGGFRLTATVPVPAGARL
jgi:two-component system sensor histidine kinase DesK